MICYVIPHATVHLSRVGCGYLWVTDGIWKTVFPHCMFRVTVSHCMSYVHA